MVWSYSRISTYAQCKYQFYLKYIVNDTDEYMPEGNYYAEVGSYVHSILEKIFKGELSVDDAAQYFVDNYENNVFYSVKQSIMDKTFDMCADYFADLSLEWLNDFDIVGVEKEIETYIGEYKFTGFIDLLIRDKKTGDFIIIDHKSAKYPFSKKTQKLLKASENSFESYKKQMYLYSHAIKEMYGVYPKWIIWNHFKDHEVVRIPFNEKDYANSIDWFIETIREIKMDESYPENQEYFYCHNLCDFRHSCEYARFEE